MSDEPTETTHDADPTVGPEPARDPGRLRSAAFLCTMIAGFLAGMGALLTWTTFGLADRNAAVLDQIYKGVDLTEGKIALGCALVMLVGVMAFRGLARPGRIAVSTLIIVAGFVTVGASGATIVTAGSRLRNGFVDDMMASSPGRGAGTGVDGDTQRRHLQDLVDTSLGAGVWLTLVGGFLGFVGGTLSLADATRLHDDDDGAVVAI
ncbi:MAG: Trp biosynthesis-associated membrane protein [Actinomycetota bacterium]